jgi:hypothetical protein
MKDVKILPTAVSPAITYQHHAFYLGILLSNKDYIKEFYNDYILLHIHPERDNLDFQIKRWYGFPSFYLDEYVIIKNGDWDIYLRGASHEKIIDDIIIGIDNEQYIIGTYDEFYDPNKYNYKKKHNIHDCFLYGYNLNEKIFYTAGYLENSQYKEYTLKFEDYLNAVKDYENSENSINIKFLRFKKNIVYNIDVSQIKTALRAYLNGENIYFEDKVELYGVNIYDILMNKIKNNDYDLREYHVLWEHKKIMSDRIKFLIDSGHELSQQMLSESNEIATICEKLFLYLAKCSVTNKAVFNNTNILDDIRQREKNLYNKIIECL